MTASQAKPKSRSKSRPKSRSKSRPKSRSKGRKVNLMGTEMSEKKFKRMVKEVSTSGPDHEVGLISKLTQYLEGDQDALNGLSGIERALL